MSPPPAETGGPQQGGLSVPPAASPQPGKTSLLSGAEIFLIAVIFMFTLAPYLPYATFSTDDTQQQPAFATAPLRSPSDLTTVSRSNGVKKEKICSIFAAI